MNDKASNLEFVTVVMTVLNGEAFIREAVDSVLQQTYPHIELIVVNDGSSDSTGAILDEYKTRIKVIVHERPHGISRSRNEAIAAAKGDFLAILDGDDIMLPDHISNMVELAARYPDAGTFISDYCNFFQGTFEPSHFSTAPQLMALLQSTSENELLLTSAQATEILSVENFSIAGTFFIRRTFCEALGAFDETLKACEDFHLMFRLATHAPVLVSKRVAMHRRLHDHNITSRIFFMSESYCKSRWDLVRHHATKESRQFLLPRAKLYRKSYLKLAVKNLSPYHVWNALGYYLPFREP